MTSSSKRIFVAGHQGMVGFALVRQLTKNSSVEIITRTRAELNLVDQQSVANFFAEEPIDEAYLSAAKVGGIHANNTYPARFIYINLMMECNVIHQAWRGGVKKLLFLGSSCIYPHLATQPIEGGRVAARRLSPPTSPMRWPRLPASGCVKATIASMAPITAALCPLTSMAPGITFIRKTAMLSPPCCAVFTKPNTVVLRVLPSGVRERHCGNFSMWMTWRVPA